MKYDKECACARQAAVTAGTLQLERSRVQPGIERKPDNSPVTDVDRQCEEIIFQTLLGAFPEDGFLGEETKAAAGTSGRRWIVDPLDGTRPYLRGIPTYSTLIALEDNGTPVVGVLHFPALGQTYWAQKGGGAFRDGTLLHVSPSDDLSRAMGSAFGFVEKAGGKEAECCMDFMTSLDYAYGFMDAYSYAGVAAGRLDVCVNLVDRPWDCIAAACLVKEAGGRYSDIHGNETVHNGTIVLSNGVLHDSVCAFFSRCKPTG